LTKLDILDGLSEIKVGTYYKLNGKRISRYPASEAELREVEVEYETFPGWQTKIADVRSWEDLPNQAKAYVVFIQDYLQVPGKFAVNYIGVTVDH
jgi:adenylosuccinate synthase